MTLPQPDQKHRSRGAARRALPLAPKACGAKAPHTSAANDGQEHSCDTGKTRSTVAADLMLKLLLKFGREISKSELARSKLGSCEWAITDHALTMFCDHSP